MRVGWLADDHDPPGGAELTQAEFLVAAPTGVDIVHCPPGEVEEGLDAYVVHNCVTYGLEDIWATEAKPLVKYQHDQWPHGDDQVRTEILSRAKLVFCSPLQRERFPYPHSVSELIPPQVSLDRFRKASQRSRKRSGAVSVAAWANPAKAAYRCAEWGFENGGIDFYGTGPYAPSSAEPVAYDDMPNVLARYERFVFLPIAVEPFGRLAVEAWAAGCQVIVNKLVGARYWIEQAPEKLECAAQDFWHLVTG